MPCPAHARQRAILTARPQCWGEGSLERRHCSVWKCNYTIFSHFNGRFAQIWIAYPLIAIYYNPWNADTSLFCKVDRFFGPFSTWTVQNSLYNVDACLPLTQGSPPPLINPTTGLYNTTGILNTSLWSAFLAHVHQGRALEHACVALNSTSTHYYAYLKYTRSLWNTDTSIFWTLSGGPMVSGLERFHCKVYYSLAKFQSHLKDELQLLALQNSLYFLPAGCLLFLMLFSLREGCCFSFSGLCSASYS